MLRGVEQLMQRHADGEDQREHFKTVKDPAEVRGDERFPLRAVERAIPGRRRDDGGFAHHCLLYLRGWRVRAALG
jgi:hypothetical protein